MKFKNILSVAALATLPLFADAATIVVPVAGTGPGANNSQWQSELTLHSSAPRAMSLALTLRQGKNASAPVTVTLQARETISIADVVKSKFGVSSGTGAITIDVTDRDAAALAVTSRTFNVSAAGEFGQDIPAYKIDGATAAGDIVTLAAPSNAAAARFNFGIYAHTATSVRWELVRANGIVAAGKDVTYSAGEQAQYNGGVESLLGVTPMNNDTVYARVNRRDVLLYGSAINNASGDPTFVNAVRTREDIIIHLLGVDLDENGTVDIHDANHDGVLDSPIDIYTTLFDSYFRIVARGEFGETVTLEVVSSESRVEFLNEDTVQVMAGGLLKNTEGSIVVRAKAQGTTSQFTIPLRYR
jgi:hypothetical protein